jgi:hypothetical protein
VSVVCANAGWSERRLRERRVLSALTCRSVAAARADEDREV